MSSLCNTFEDYNIIFQQCIVWCDKLLLTINLVTLETVHGPTGLWIAYTEKDKVSENSRVIVFIKVALYNQKI